MSLMYKILPFIAAFLLIGGSFQEIAAQASYDSRDDEIGEANDTGDNGDSETGATSSISLTPLSHSLLEHNQNLRKVDILLNARSTNRLETGKLYIGGALTSIGTYQRSNTDSKFGYLMRHPTANNQVGDNVSEVVLHSAQVMLAGAPVDWLTVFTEILYDPEQSFGAGTNTALGRNQLQLRKGVILIGNLEKFPLYASIGKSDVNFGLTGSVSPFTNSTLWHAFGGLAYNATVGLVSNGFNMSFTAIQGGAQFRAIHAPVDSTAVPSRVNNFAVDGNYTLDAGGDVTVMAGGSYLYGSAYCQTFPVFHFQPCNDVNSAYTAYGKIQALNKKLTVMGGFAQTTDVWPGTANPNPPLDVFEASKVSSKTIAASYMFAENDLFKWMVSGEFSDFVAGPSGAPWERQNQWVAGLCAMVGNSSRLFVEMFRTEGYAPLNFISGGHIPDVPNVSHSDADARSHGIVIGGQITL